MTYPKFDEILKGFVNSDFVEYEFNENVYYLAYDGFVIIEEAEASINLTKVITKSKAEQYEEFVNSFGGEKRFKISIFSVIFILGILVTLLLRSNQNSIIVDNNDSKFNINDEILHQVKTDIEQAVDSIQHLNNKE